MKKSLYGALVSFAILSCYAQTPKSIPRGEAEYYVAAYALL
jgi:hypothetical protein